MSECLYKEELQDEELILKLESFRVENLDSEDEVPIYEFWIYLKEKDDVVGHLSLRTSTTYEEEFYWGNLGYSVFPQYQGNRYALKASRLALIFARQMRMQVVYMTTDPTNFASIKTILNLGGEYIDTIQVPHDSSLYLEEKCETNQRYRVHLNPRKNLQQIKNGNLLN